MEPGLLEAEVQSLDLAGCSCGIGAAVGRKALKERRRGCVVRWASRILRWRVPGLRMCSVVVAGRQREEVAESRGRMSWPGAVEEVLAGCRR